MKLESRATRELVQVLRGERQPSSPLVRQIVEDIIDPAELSARTRLTIAAVLDKLCRYGEFDGDAVYTACRDVYATTNVVADQDYDELLHDVLILLRRETGS